MAFDIFQTETGTLKKMEISGTGSLTVADSITVDVDPDFGFTQTYTEDGEEVKGRQTFITTNPISDLQDFWDESHRRWVLTYKSNDWTVNEGVPRHGIGTNSLDHIEVALT